MDVWLNLQPEPDLDCMRLVLLETLSRILEQGPIRGRKQVRYSCPSKFGWFTSIDITLQRIDITKLKTEILPDHDSPRMIYPDEMIPIQAEFHNDVLVLSGFGLETQAFGSQDSSRFAVLR